MKKGLMRAGILAVAILGTVLTFGAAPPSTIWNAINAHEVAAQTTVGLLGTADSTTVPGLLVATMTHAEKLDAAILGLRGVDTTTLDSAALNDYTQHFLDLFSTVAQLHDSVATLGYNDLAAEFQTCWSDALCIFWHQSDLDPQFAAAWGALIANAKPPQQLIDSINAKPPQQLIDSVYLKQ